MQITTENQVVTADKQAAAYVRWVFGICLTSLALIVIINAVIDPRSYFNWFLHDAINAIKPKALGSRIEKSLAVTLQDLDAIIVGTSRSQIGINPLHTGFRNVRTYNLSLSATNTFETGRVLEYVRRQQQAPMLVWGLDFLSFSTRRDLGQDFNSSLFASKGNAPYILLNYLISGQTIRAVLDTIIINVGDGNHSITFSDRNGFLDKSGQRVNHRKLFTSILEEKFLVDPETYGGFEYGLDRVEIFHNAVQSIVMDGSRVVLFISPVHARQLEAIRGLGLWEIFEQWKRDLVAVTEEVNALAGKKETIALWDFSGYNSITTEPVPAQGENADMHWYWESSHYKKETGDLVLDRILGIQHSERQLPEDFGVLLASGNIETHLETIRTQRNHYTLEQPEEIADVLALVQKTAPLRNQAKKIIGVRAK